MTLGPPGKITHLTIPPDMITPSSFVAQWSEPSSDPVCGRVRYIVTVYTGGIVISNNTIEGTTYTAAVDRTNLNYTINVTAYNAAGISATTSKQVWTTTDSEGKHFVCLCVCVCVSVCELVCRQSTAYLW